MMDETQDETFYVVGWRLKPGPGLAPNVGGIGHVVNCYDAIRAACDRWNQKETHIHHYPVMVSKEWIATYRAIVIRGRTDV